MLNTQYTVWLDCDPGLDDTFAIIYAAHAKQINLLGLSTSPGNTSLHNTTQNALDVLFNIGRSDVPVFMGSNTLIKGQMKLAQHMHGSNGLGGVQLPKSHQKAIDQLAFQKIYQRIINYQGKIIWANTGSLTNLCILLFSYPDLKSKIQKVVMMGGAIGRGNISPAAEFNIYFDPTAFQGVLRLKGQIPLVMIPLQVTHQNKATPQIIEHFKKQRQYPFAEAIYNMLIAYKDMYFKNYKFQYPPIHDPCTIFYILHPQEFQVHPCKITVDTFPSSYGRTNCLFVDQKNPSQKIKSIDKVAKNLLNKNVKFWDEMQKILDQIFCLKQKNI